jgi:hypothetical protein
LKTWALHVIATIKVSTVMTWANRFCVNMEHAASHNNIQPLPTLLIRHCACVSHENLCVPNINAGWRPNHVLRLRIFYDLESSPVCHHIYFVFYDARSLETGWSPIQGGLLRVGKQLWCEFPSGIWARNVRKRVFSYVIRQSIKHLTWFQNKTWWHTPLCTTNYSEFKRFQFVCLLSWHSLQEAELIVRRLRSLISLMMEAVRTSETSVNIYLTTRQYIPEDSRLHTCRRENLKSHYDH